MRTKLLNGLGLDEMFLIGVLGVLFIQPKQLAKLLHWFRTTRGKLANMRYDFEDKMEKVLRESVDPDSTPQLKPLHTPTATTTEEISVEEAASTDIADREQARKTRMLSRHRLSQRDEEENREESEKICTRILEELLWQEADKVALYSPLKNEPDITPLLSAALKSGKKLYLPLINSETQSIHLARVKNLDEDLIIGTYGIKEPAEHCRQTLDPEDIKLLLVPGIAFGESGQRLGHGQGWYDQLLSRYPHAEKCGVAWESQIFNREQVPQHERDVPLQRIFTPERMIKSGKKT